MIAYILRIDVYKSDCDGDDLDDENHDIIEEDNIDNKKPEESIEKIKTDPAPLLGLVDVMANANLTQAHDYSDQVITDDFHAVTDAENEETEEVIEIANDDDCHTVNEAEENVVDEPDSVLAHMESALVVLDNYDVQLKNFDHFGQKMNTSYQSRETNQKVFICPVCSRTFGRKCNLNRHLAIHRGEKNYGCPICHKKFRQKEHVKKHMTGHSEFLHEVRLEMNGSILSS